MLHFKLQIVCFLITLYILSDYLVNKRKGKLEKHTALFLTLIGVSFVNLVLDCVTVYTVNHLAEVNLTLNKILHLIFIITIDTSLFLIFRYYLEIIGIDVKQQPLWLLFYLIYLATIIVAAVFIKDLRFVEGSDTNYTLGVSAYTVYASGLCYIIARAIVYAMRWRYLNKNKRRAQNVGFLAMGIVLVLQFFFPEILITSASVTITILAFYINIEDNDKSELEEFQSEMLHAFADIVESRDGNTGQHVKRTTEYVKIIAEELRAGGKYAKLMTKDYIDMLMQAAPMHDVGKIAVRDSVLQKPGRLTDEEFEEIKSHTVEGEKLISNSFKRVGSKECVEMARLTALYHHEKWNGRGYPEGKSGEDIPLCARIMAVADVFDAVSQDRCYRKAMTMDQSFEIIEKGVGTDFDPDIANAFIAARKKVEEVHAKFNYQPPQPDAE